MAWIFLIIAGFCEVMGVISMKWASTKKNLIGVFAVGLSFTFSFFFLSQAMHDLPMGTAYAIWTGIGTAGSSILGIILFKESSDWLRIMFISFIMIGAIGLKLIS
jgi:paired small multidrug resistance pump